MTVCWPVVNTLLGVGMQVVAELDLLTHSDPGNVVLQMIANP
jgi:hypothetical protein